MKHFIVERKDIYGNTEYLSVLTENDCEYNCSLSKALLVSENEKKLIRKIARKNYLRNPTFIPLKSFPLLGQKALSILHEYDCDFLVDILTYSRNEGELGKELLKAATDDERNVITYAELSDKVAHMLIEKYDLKKKENYSW